MTFHFIDFRELTFAILFFYVFFISQIYLSLWAALFHLLKIGLRLLFATNLTYQKAAVSVYVILILLGYLYKLRGVLFSKEETFNNHKLIKLQSDKKLQQRIGISILILLAINVVAIILRQYMN